jgi:hypothetical protein
MIAERGDNLRAVSSAERSSWKKRLLDIPREVGKVLRRGYGREESREGGKARIHPRDGGTEWRWEVV